jgi:hypothetical protein
VISAANIAGAIGGIVTVVNSQARSFCSSFRVKKITIWPSSVSVATPCEVLWFEDLSNFSKDDAHSRVVPGGITITTPSVFVPPKNGTMSWWMIPVNLSATTVFLLTCGDESVIDLEVEWTLGNGYTASTFAVTAAAVGTLGYKHLDGATVELVPQGRPVLT